MTEPESEQEFTEDEVGYVDLLEDVDPVGLEMSTENVTVTDGPDCAAGLQDGDHDGDHDDEVL